MNHTRTLLASTLTVLLQIGSASAVQVVSTNHHNSDSSITKIRLAEQDVRSIFDKRLGKSALDKRLWKELLLTLDKTESGYLSNERYTDKKVFTDSVQKTRSGVVFSRMVEPNNMLDPKSYHETLVVSRQGNIQWYSRCNVFPDKKDLRAQLDSRRVLLHVEHDPVYYAFKKPLYIFQRASALASRLHNMKTISKIAR